MQALQRERQQEWKPRQASVSGIVSKSVMPLDRLFPTADKKQRETTEAGDGPSQSCEDALGLVTPSDCLVYGTHQRCCSSCSCSDNTWIAGVAVSTPRKLVKRSAYFGDWSAHCIQPSHEEDQGWRRRSSDRLLR